MKDSIQNPPALHLYWNVQAARKAVLTVASILMILAMSLFVPEFRLGANMQAFVHDVSHLMILALGFSVVLLAGNLDLSVGGVYLLSLSLLRIWFDSAFSESSYWSTFVVGLIICGLFFALGVGLGWLVSLRYRLSLVISLSVGIIAGSVGYLLRLEYPTWSDPFLAGESLVPPQGILLVITLLAVAATVQAVRYFWPRWDWIKPASVIWLATIMLCFVVLAYQGLAMVTLVCAFVIFGVYFFLHHTGIGRAIHAVGYNAQAARLCGVDLRAVSMSIFGVSLFLTALASMFERRPIEPSGFTDVYFHQLHALAAVLIGGVSLRGGFGCISNSIAGVLFVVSWVSMCHYFGFGPMAQYAGIGFLLLVSVFLEPARDGDL